jgi:uncharacterized MnhB-related membrane protein
MPEITTTFAAETDTALVRAWGTPRRISVKVAVDPQEGLRLGFYSPVRIQIKRGLDANLPGFFAQGEPAWTLDTFRFFIGTGVSKRELPVFSVAGGTPLKSSTDAAADNSSLYFSITQNGVVWKTSGGVVTLLGVSDPELIALSGLTSAADKLPYFTGAGTAATTTLSSFSRTLLDDPDAATARATLGAGTVTSISAAVPVYMNVTGTPITGFGTLTISFNSQVANKFFASPVGSAGSPDFRALDVSDLANDLVTFAKVQNVSGPTILGKTAAGSGDIEQLVIGTTMTLSGSNVNVADNGVTYAKMQDISATDKILGRASAGAGDPEEIPCTSFARTILDDTTAAGVRATIGAGTSNFDGAYASLTSIPSTFTPSAHATSHKSGGSDPIRLDELAAPTASIGFNGQQATSFRVENRTTDPGSPAVGQIWLRTDL